MSSSPSAHALAAGGAAPPVRPRHIAALAALVAGACAMGISPVFVRHAEIGPFASAFWRVAAALPVLFVWFAAEVGLRNAGRVLGTVFLMPALWICGTIFALDLIFWHLSILNTTMANATFLATLAPVWVALGSRIFIGEPVERRVLAGLVVCVAGGAVLLGGSYTLAPERLVGDFYGLITSVFFGAYFLAVRVLRRRIGPGTLIFSSSIVTAIVLFIVAAFTESALVPASMSGLAALAALAFFSHAGGQGLLAYALGHLSAAFSALVIFLEALAAAVFGWLFFAEAIGPEQAAGGALILVGLFIGRPRG